MVFDRFYQVNRAHSAEQEGSGIGLSLTRELVELHKGTIHVESEEGRGTTFTVRLPKFTAHLKPEEICELREEEGEAVPHPESASLDAEEGPRHTAAGALPATGRRSILVVDDNADVRAYIRGILSESCSVLEAADGEKGWTIALENTPDIIVSDVMMPALDGYALCRRLKADERTSHIPVILLTAKASTQDKIEGFDVGADDYIMKPFEPAELESRLRNLAAQRQRLQEHFRKHGLIELDREQITAVDQRFLQTMMSIITEHLADESFGVERLAQLMAVSPSSLLKKVEALAGEPPNAVIRRTRLTKAARLLEGKFGNISEVALEVGFSNPSYFTECFRHQFGVTPSEYRRTEK
jgi:DNA-binding response OmpR family regulator